MNTSTQDRGWDAVDELSRLASMTAAAVTNGDEPKTNQQTLAKIFIRPNCCARRRTRTCLDSRFRS